MKVLINLEELEFLYDLFPSKESFIQALGDRGYVSSGETDKDHVGVFNRIFTLFRKRQYIKGVKPYKPGTPAWATLTSIADEAWIFSKEFDMDMREGFAKFMEIAKDNGWMGLKDLSRNKFKITSLYELEKELMEDKNSYLTDEIYRVFTGEMANRYGIFKDYSVPEQYIHFVKASAYCKSLNLQATEFVEKVIDVWAWTGNPILPHKLYAKSTQEAMQSAEGLVPVQPKVRKLKIRKGHERWE